MRPGFVNRFAVLTAMMLGATLSATLSAGAASKPPPPQPAAQGTITLDYDGDGSVPTPSSSHGYSLHVHEVLSVTGGARDQTNGAIRLIGTTRGTSARRFTFSENETHTSFFCFI